MPKYKAAVLGAGWRGFGHIKAFLANPSLFELCAVCDRDTERMKNTLGKIGVSRTIYADADEMLSKERPEIFCFATQPDMRLELVRLGIRHKVRAIAYEKPMATSLSEAKQICELCDAANVKQIVCHQHKYGRHWLEVKKIVDSGLIGRVRHIHATSKGWFFYYITHLVDYAMWLVDYPELEWVSGSLHGRGKLTDTHPSPDYMMGQIVFKNKIRALFECGPLSPGRGVTENFWYDAGITVYGDEGFAEVIVGRGWKARTRDGKCLGCPDISLDEVGDTAPYLADLAKWLDDDSQTHPCNGKLAYTGFEASMGMLLSGIESRAITLPVDISTPITERMVRELPSDPFSEGIKS